MNSEYRSNLCYLETAPCPSAGWLMLWIISLLAFHYTPWLLSSAETRLPSQRKQGIAEGSPDAQTGLIKLHKPDGETQQQLYETRDAAGFLF